MISVMRCTLAATFALVAQAAVAQNYCDKQPDDLARQRCKAVYQNRNIPEDVARAESGTTHISWVYDAQISPDGKLLASAGRDQTVKLWDFASGKFIRNLGKHSGWVRNVVFSLDSKIVYSLADNDGIKALEVATGQTLRSLPEGDKSKRWYRFAISADGRFIAGGGGGEPKAATIVATSDLSVAHQVPIETSFTQAVFTPLRPVAAIAYYQNIRFVNAETGQVVGKAGVADGPDRLAFSPDGALLAIATRRGIEIWDLTEQKRIQLIPSEKSIPSVFDLAFTPDKSIIIACTDLPTAYDVATGKSRGNFGDVTDLCHSVAITKDGKYAVTSHMGSDIRVWEVATGKFVRRFGQWVEQP